MKKVLTLFAVAAMAFAAQATEWTAADGTANCEYAPVYGYNFETDQHNQMQYPAAELTGLAAGTEITGVKFYTSTPTTVNALGGSVTISLANMDDVTPWTPDAWGGVSGDLLNVPVTAVATVVPAADEDGVWAITFDNAFTYTGGALLIDVQSTAGEYQDTYFYGKEMGSYLVMSSYGYAGSTKGDVNLPKATFTYEGGGGQEEGIALLSEANALEDNAAFTFDGDAVVTVFRSGYLFLRDESGYAMISGVQGNFENGQVLSQGWNATKTSNDGWVSYTDAAGLSASGETDLDLAAAIVPYSVDESLLNAFVCIKNQTPSFFPARSFTLPDGTKIPKTENLWAGDADATTGNYNVYGVICKFDGKLMFNILSYENYVDPQPEPLRGDVNLSGDVTIADVSALIDYLLTEDPTGISLENADCNLVDGVNIADVSKLIDYLLTESWD